MSSPKYNYGDKLIVIRSTNKAWKSGDMFVVGEMQTRAGFEGLGDFIYFSKNKTLGVWENNLRPLTKLDKALR